jgi:hypothetical protein
VHVRALPLALVVLAGFVPTAHATLVYEKGFVNGQRPTIWVAGDDGSAARRVAIGENPRVSADGQTLVYGTQYIRSSRPKLIAVPVAGGAKRVLLDPWWDGTAFAWSPDSKTIAAVTGPEVGTKRLELIDVATGNRRTLAKGFFQGASFSPAGDRLVYARATRDDYPAASDLYVAALADGAPHRITSDHHSAFPLWGPSKIAFAVTRKPKRNDAPKQDLYLIAPDGSGRTRLTRTKIGFLLTGLQPTWWSDDGTRLLAEFGGQDTSYAKTVDPVTGRERLVGKIEQSIIGSRLSRDGSTILGWTGSFEPSAHHDVVTIPYSGGKPHVLARNAFNPDWNR